MKEKLYAIPVNDAFNEDCECPICAMYNKLETDAVDFTMDNSYMVDDVRMETDAKGFCNKHIKMVYNKENRLGMALVMSTHMKKINEEMRKLIDQSTTPKKTSIFSKANDSDNELVKYIENLEKKCFVCERIDNFFQNYVNTVFYLYKTDNTFAQKYNRCKGFCVGHYKILIENAPKKLGGDTLAQFVKTTNALFIDNMDRVYEDVDWFCKKFDYKNTDAPWKNSKDSLPRGLIKLNRE